MEYLKPFDTFFKATPDELNYDWDYYNCTNCHSDFRVYRPKEIKCIYCQSIDVHLIETTTDHEKDIR